MYQNVTIIGGGVLGTQIGLMCAYTGHDVTFWLRSEGSIGRTQPKIDHYSKAMEDALDQAAALIGNPMGSYLYPRGLVNDWKSATSESIEALKEEWKKNKKRVHITLDLAEALKDADIVIEAMTEDPEQKKDIFSRMKDLMPDKTILCTNSSTLLPSTFASFTGRPEKFCAMHFANEIWKSNTAEIMGHLGTSLETIEKVTEFAKEINMIPLVLHKEQPGYILNSMLVPFLESAEALWANGVADPETIDLTWKLATGAPAGPFQIMDIVGLKTCYDIVSMKPEANDEKSVYHRISTMLKDKLDKGEGGVNSGKGFFDYTKK
jgi:3-hydroxybutyryl-CoA dehydrogenase